MKSNTVHTIRLVAILTALMVSTGLTNVRDNAKAEPAAATQIPDTSDKIWQAIDLKTAELKQTIDSGTLTNVHHQAFAIRDLAAGLAAHATSLPDDRKVKMQGDIKFVATLAERLDTAGDDNDKASAADNYQKLMKVLAGLRAASTGNNQ
jgi:hypothetical protein